MSDIHHAKGPTTFTGILERFGNEKDSKHVRSSEGKELYVHKGKPSGHGEKASKARAIKQEEGAKKVKEAITREYGPKVAELVFGSGKLKGDLNKGVTVSDLKAIKTLIDTDHDIRSVRKTQQYIERNSDMLEFIKGEIKSTKQIQTFLRGNVKEGAIVNEHLKDTAGEHFEKTCTMLKYSIDHGGVSVMRDDDVAKLKPQDRDGAVKRSLDNFNKAMTAFIGGTDPSSIKKAAAEVPREYCDLLATAYYTIENDKSLDSTQKLEMQKIIFANFGALRLINPTLLSNNDDMSPSGKMALRDLAKQIQNVCNGVKFGAKESIANRDEMNKLIDQWAPAYQTFMHELVARGRPIV